jgi:hypothetical protein
MDITETTLTTTMAHNARSNGIMEVFWRFWNRCMRLLPDDQYQVWPTLVARIQFAYNTAPHQSLGGTSPFELYYGITCRNTFSRILTDQVLLLPQPPDEVGDAENARLFALAVKTSVCAFVQFARNLDQYVKNETATLLNQNGSPRQFVIGAMVKARSPPTQAELLATGRRSNHVSAWRGPCQVLDQMSSTTYRLLHLDSEREFERSIANLLPWQATSRKKARNGQFDESVSVPFKVNEFIAVRDEPGNWIFVAKVTTVKPELIIVHYYRKLAPCFFYAWLAPFPLGPHQSIRIATTATFALLGSPPVGFPQHFARRPTLDLNGGLTSVL